MFYLLIFLAAVFLGALFTFFTEKIAKHYNIIDKPEGGGGRKIHRFATPLLGGVGIFLAYFLLLFIFSDHFLSGDLTLSHLLGFFLGALVLVVGGVLDDKYDLRPGKQIVFPLLALVAVIFGGVEIARLSNPFGGIIDLNTYFFISPLLVSIWLLGMMYTTKLLDGIDGLVSGIGAIASFIIFLFTLSQSYYQPDIAFAALVFAGVVFGFLIFNWHPAKIFLGEGGSLLIGYVLGVLAIISGAKIAIALLIMGIPILDVFWTITRRLLKGKNPFRFSDRKHLHHRLLDLGLSQKQTVFVFYTLSFVFGFSGLFLQSRGKFMALIFLALIMFLVVLFFWRLDREKKLDDLRGMKKPKLLLHVCCAPCASYITLEILRKDYDVSWYFCNPNLDSKQEYLRRLRAVKKVARQFFIPLFVEAYNKSSWLEKIKGYEPGPEGCDRCLICYFDRLEQSAVLAKKENFEFFSTSLLMSPYKNEEAITKNGNFLAKEYGLKFLSQGLRSLEIQIKSRELAVKLALYSQKYCGCEYSLGKRLK